MSHCVMLRVTHVLCVTCLSPHIVTRAASRCDPCYSTPICDPMEWPGWFQLSSSLPRFACQAAYVALLSTRIFYP
jgi:hypothetical protein